MADKFDIRDAIAGKFIEALNAGVLPWRKPWTGGANGRPHNALSRKTYRGTNALYLGLIQMLKGYPTGGWLTFKGVTALGGRITPGEKATAVMFWKFLKTKDKVTGQDKTIPMCRYYNVFNVAQTEGCRIAETEPTRTLAPIDAAEKIFHGMPNRPTVNVCSSDAAFYRPGTDEIVLPLMNQFVNAESFYSTAFHEMAHSTGHKTRLNRGLDGTFGSDPYSREELVAEMTAAFLAADAGILDKVQDNSTAYVQHWAARLGKEPRLILDAASAAQKAADYILGVSWGKASESEDEGSEE